MAKRTFLGYVDGLCRDISGMQTSNLRRLVAAALGPCPNLVEPLFFLAALKKNKYYHLMSLVRATPLENEYRAAFQVLKEEGSMEALLNSPRCPRSYRKIYDDFVAQATAPTKNLATTERLRQRTVHALEMSSLTRYKLCRDLKLNPGNVYAYLSGDLSKVSQETAQRICDYVYQSLDN